MDNRAEFTGPVIRTAAADCAGFVAQALATAIAVAAVAMGVVLLLAQ